MPLPPIPPSRATLNRIVDANHDRGHENEGFLSEAYGFMPSAPPLRNLPRSHRAWDQIAEQLPELYRSLQLRDAFDDMPELSASEDALDDASLCRASALMSMFAHAYVRVQPDAPAALPLCIQRPWEEVTRRLGRPAPVLSYIDLIMYNWKLRDPARAGQTQSERLDRMRVEHLDLLIPTVGNQAEQIFYLTQVEILAQCAPVVGAIVRAQEAVVREDLEALEKHFHLIHERLRHVTEVSLQKINPNPHSESYVDPVVWAKTVAPFAVPISPGIQGPSGTSAPIFHLLDTFFGRISYESLLGKETILLRRWYPRAWRDFLHAVEQVSVGDFVQQSGNRHLQGVFQSVFDGYASEKGLLGYHRLKVYGYLETAFKVGRTKTIGGFAGLFRDRAWEEVDGELASSRNERVAGSPRHQYYVQPRSLSRVDGGTSDVVHLMLDASGSGMAFEPGDRCEILPENAPELVQKTLHAMRARGGEEIKLDRRWREAMATRFGSESEPTLPLARLLTYGRIGAVARETARELLALTASSKLRSILNARTEDQWELWDLLELLHTGGFDTRRLWRAEPWERESVCKLVPPERPRQYSVSFVARTESDREEPSGRTRDVLRDRSALRLTVGMLRYRTRDSAVTRKDERAGATSTFLGRISRAGATERIAIWDAGTGGDRVWTNPVHPLHFHLPRAPSRPVVMFAAGTGIAPFRGFLMERARNAGSGENFLFFGIRTREQFSYYAAELEEYVRKGVLRLQVACSREDFASIRGGTRSSGLSFEPHARQHLPALIEEDENAAMLWYLLRSERDGGRGAYLYVCGRTDFAASITAALKRVIRQGLSTGADPADRASADAIFYHFVAEGRYMQDVFTTYSAPYGQRGRPYDASEVARHNSTADDYWMILDGRVYDLTEFVQLHAGGRAIIAAHAGLDATHAYRTVLHHLNPEVDAMLGMYEIGYVRRLDFAAAWIVVAGRGGLHYLSLKDAFGVWVRFLYLVVEMENALTHDYSFLPLPITAVDVAATLTPLKLQLVADVHRGFMLNYFDAVLGEDLDAIWEIAVALGAPEEELRRARWEADAVMASNDCARVRRCGDAMHAHITRLLRAGGSADTDWEPLRSVCAILEAENKRFLSEVKAALRDGVRTFELHEAATAQAGGSLTHTALLIPSIAQSYCARVTQAVHAIPSLHAAEGMDSTELPSSPQEMRALPGHGTIAR